MKEVVKVSIGGYAFTLDVEAYEAAKNYLDELQSYYSRRSGGDEVMEGLEERFAELLLDRVGSDGVASKPEVAAAMAILGKPSAIESDDDSAEIPAPVAEAPKEFEKSAEGEIKERRKLFRDPEHHIFGGVCTGLANYFGIDVVIVRLIWVALLLGGIFLSDRTSWDSAVLIPILGYIICWISMPVPQNQHERNAFARSATSSHKSEGWTVFGRICCVGLGALLILAGGTWLVAFIGAACGISVVDITNYVPDALSGFVMKGWYWVLIVLVTLLPALFLIYEGIRLTFDLRPPKYHPGIICAVVWILAVIALVFVALFSLLPMLR